MPTACRTSGTRADHPPTAESMTVRTRQTEIRARTASRVGGAGAWVDRTVSAVVSFTCLSSSGDGLH
jgi:hypothetical protein